MVWAAWRIRSSTSAAFGRVQDLQQCRLVKGSPCVVSFARTIGVVSLTVAR
jgi:hypothetical protein